MPAPTVPSQVITANRLGDGIVVFVGRAESGSGCVWVESLEDARLFADPERLAIGLERARVDERSDFVIDAYAIEVRNADGRVRAQSLRERIRAQGPTVRADLGKQASFDSAQL